VEIADTLELLLGSWALTRLIDDRPGATSTRLDGQATWRIAPAGDGGLRRARLDELGELTAGPHRVTAHRTLDAVSSDAGDLQLFFADGRPFIELDLRAGAWSATHLCGDDIYEISTKVRDLDTIEERWHVRGPEKDYDALSVLRRLPKP
jgi:hypothetical protein